MKQNIIITGGGTMGHISPNIALLPLLTKYYNEVHYIGSKNSLEESKTNELTKTYSNLYFHAIPSAKLNRSNWFKNFGMPFVILKSIRQTKKLFKTIKPSVVFSKGGYVSVPVCLVAPKMGIPLVIHESDLTMGLANKLASRKATTICSTFPETTKGLKHGVWTGSPVSERLINANKTTIAKKYNLNPQLKTITITGGSLGAVPINSAIEKILPNIVKKYNIIHLTGKGKRINFTHHNYHQEEFSNEIGGIFKASDLVISRAGSNTIFELALLKTPMLLIPLSKKVSRGDQIDNAEYFKKLKIAEVLPEENLSNLEDSIDETIKQLGTLKSELINQNFTNGLDRLFLEIYKATKKHKK